MPKDIEERPRRSTGQVKEPGHGRLPNGQPDLRPSAGYEGNEPVQYSDESDAQFAIRKADFEERRMHAEEIEAGGATRETERKRLTAKHEAEMAELDRRVEEGTLRA